MAKRYTKKVMEKLARETRTEAVVGLIRQYNLTFDSAEYDEIRPFDEFGIQVAVETEFERLCALHGLNWEGTKAMLAPVSWYQVLHAIFPEGESNAKI